LTISSRKVIKSFTAKAVDGNELSVQRWPLVLDNRGRGAERRLTLIGISVTRDSAEVAAGSQDNDACEQHCPVCKWPTFVSKQVTIYGQVLHGGTRVCVSCTPHVSRNIRLACPRRNHQEVRSQRYLRCEEDDRNEFEFEEAQGVQGVTPVASQDPQNQSEAASLSFAAIRYVASARQVTL